MGKKGISQEEKRKRVLQVFLEKHGFYHLKDVEKEAQKKGIHPMLIKDILNGLVADYLVETEKIGSSNFFWSFPSKAYVTKKNLLKNTEDQIS